MDEINIKKGEPTIKRFIAPYLLGALPQRDFEIPIKEEIV